MRSEKQGREGEDWRQRAGGKQINPSPRQGKCAPLRMRVVLRAIIELAAPGSDTELLGSERPLAVAKWKLSSRNGKTAVSAISTRTPATPSPCPQHPEGTIAPHREATRWTYFGKLFDLREVVQQRSCDQPVTVQRRIALHDFLDQFAQKLRLCWNGPPRQE